MEKCIPHSKLPTRLSRPWLNKSLIQLIRKKNNLFTRAKHCARLRPRYNKLRNRVTLCLKNAKEAFFNNINPSTKNYWKIIKNLNKNTSTLPILVQGQTHAESDLDKANLLSGHFSRSFNIIDPPLSDSCRETIPPIDCPAEFFISEEDVFRYLTTIDCSKATGPDNISGIMLKNTATSITPIVTVLFNMALRDSTFPTTHEVLSVFFDLSKAFDSVPHTRLLNKLKDHNVPSCIIALIHSYLCSRSQKVCISGTTSSPTCTCHIWCPSRLCVRSPIIPHIH